MKKIACIFISVIFALSLCSCSLLRLALYQSQSVKNPNATHIDYWQNGIPDTIPKFNYGKYEETFSSKTTDEDSISYMLSYSGITKQDIDAYGKALKDAGFSVSTTDGYDDYSVTGMPKDSMPDFSQGLSPDAPLDLSSMYPSVSVYLTPSDGSCFISVTLENPEK
jgi:hypothetical protein